MFNQTFKMKRSNPFFIGVKWGAALVLCISLFSCDSSLIFDDNFAFPAHAWHKDSAVTFNFSTDSIYAEQATIAINLRHTTDYSYRNLWLFMDLYIPNEPVQRDTLNLSLMDELGHDSPNVKSEGLIGGTIKESKHYYRYGVQNPPSGTYKIKLQHAMRQDVLNEVVSIGARIEKIK